MHMVSTELELMAKTEWKQTIMKGLSLFRIRDALCMSFKLFYELQKLIVDTLEMLDRVAEIPYTYTGMT